MLKSEKFDVSLRKSVLCVCLDEHLFADTLGFFGQKSATSVKMKRGLEYTEQFLRTIL